MLAEGLAWWWMSPPPASASEPVLVWKRGGGGQESGVRGQGAGELAPGAVPDPQSPNTEHGTRNTPSFSYTPLPDLYSQAARVLRSSAGQVVLARNDELGLSLHLAFLEWDGTDTGSTLEAFRHPPEACMGSIGLTLVANHPPRTFTVDGRTLVFEPARWSRKTEPVASLWS